jgi:trehalose/maltose hydrolase-like predicted phosphorylase
MAAAVTPPVVPGPASTWQIEVQDLPVEQSVNAARLAVMDGLVCSRAVSEVAGAPGRDRVVRVAGIHGPEPEALLLAGPSWIPGGWRGTGRSWTLELRTGLLSHHLDLGGRPLATRRWAAAGHLGAQAFLAPVTAEAPLARFAPSPTTLVGADGTTAVTAVAGRRIGERHLLVAQTVVGRPSDDGVTLVREATAAARHLCGRGPDALLADQRRRWDERWRRCEVVIEGDAEAELRTRFALFHLLALTDHPEELPVGARGLTGDAYGGHVFWDADVFVLPALASVAPSAARAMVEYRLRRLDVARALARESGTAGARYPWESAASGRDTTPRWTTSADGHTMAVRTGEQEIHVGADIAWAAHTYHRWTDDHDTMARAAAMTVEIARWWSSIITCDDDGRAHLRGVIGPDEYHEHVDDNAYTNRMAAWTLWEADRLVGEGLGQPTGGPPVAAAERRLWRRLASRLVLGYRDEPGRHEQFSGYDDLEPILAESIATPPFAADLLLGRWAVQRSQLIKQADVVMMHHLVPEEMPPGSLGRDLDRYLPRTTHGSTLSPAVHAAVLARAGRLEHALHWYRVALGIDLDDLTRTGAGGLHYANLGGVWQALVAGFLGLRPGPDGSVAIDPVLPSAWRRLRVRCRLKGSGIEVEALPDRARVTTDRPLPFVDGTGAPLGITARLDLVRVDGRWQRR